MSFNKLMRKMKSECVEYSEWKWGSTTGEGENKQVRSSTYVILALSPLLRILPSDVIVVVAEWYGCQKMLELK